MKLLIFGVLSLLTIKSVLSQTNEWLKLYTGNGVEFFYQKSECHDIQNGIHEEYYLIQIHNTSNNSLQLQWNYHLWNGENCINCKENLSDIKAFNAKILPGETIEGSCKNKTQNGLKIFSRFLNYKTANPVTHFTVENINVKFD